MEDEENQGASPPVGSNTVVPVVRQDSLPGSASGAVAVPMQGQGTGMPRYSGGAGPEEDDTPAFQHVQMAQPTTTSQPSRGTPIPNRTELRQTWRQGGEARVRALTSAYGEDALILGHLLFRVPPLAIRVKKGNIVYRWKPLRTKESIAVPSGNGECYIEIDLVFVGLQQLNDSFAHLISLWKKMPFCFVENKFIREMMIPDHPEDSMMLCLETMIADAVEGKPDAVWVTLITKWFNYKPYSMNAWYRRDWDSKVDPPPTRRVGSLRTPTRYLAGAGPVEEDLPVTDYEGTDIRDDAGSSIVDLSALQEPESMDFAMPPEVRIAYPTTEKDPSDPYIRPTYPVVYPWNSAPFMRRVLSGQDVPKHIGSWTDGLSMGWRSFARVPMPRNLAYTPYQVTRDLVRQGGRRPSPGQEAVNGDRNIILVIGDSITVGYLGVADDQDPPQMRAITPRQELRESGFEFVALAKEGRSLTSLASDFQNQIGSSLLKSSGGANADRLAAVVFMGGINDNPRSPDAAAKKALVRAAYDRIKSIATNAQAIAIPLTPWPICGVVDSYINDNDETAFLELAREITAAWSNSGSRVKVINTHNTELTPGCDPISTSPTTFNGEMPDGVWSGGTEHQRGVHPAEAGYIRLARNIHGQMPWRELRDRAAESQQWNVCYVEDGDTVWISRNDEIKIVRFEYVDTLETYNHFETSSWDAVFTSGQDTGRQADQQWGRIARARTATLLGCSIDTWSGGTADVELSGGQDVYGRDLGVLSRNGTNVNLTLIGEGLGVTNPGYKTPDEYTRAETEALEARRGVHSWLAQSSIAETRTFMRPYDFRAKYPSSSTGGHEFTLANPPPACSP